MLLIALFLSKNFYKVNTYNTLGAIKNLQLYNSDNSGLSQLGFWANFKVGFVLGSWFLNRYIWLTKSPTDAKPRDVVRHFRATENRKKEIRNE